MKVIANFGHNGYEPKFYINGKWYFIKWDYNLGGLDHILYPFKLSGIKYTNFNFESKNYGLECTLDIPDNTDVDKIFEKVRKDQGDLTNKG
jgi:hypothetical protein